MSRFKGVLALVPLLSLLSACGGGSGSAAFNPPAARAGLATARVVITIPAQLAVNSKQRKPDYVSPSTQSITVQVDAGVPVAQNLLPSSPGCTSAGSNAPLDCTVTVSATPGSHTLTFVTYDQINGAGNSLSANAIAVTFVSGQNPQIPVTLAGVPKSLQVAPVPGTSSISGTGASGFEFGGSAPSPLLVTAADADGNYIVGPGSPALTVAITGASAGSGIAVNPATNGNPDEFMLQSAGPGTATLTVSATPASPLAGAAVTASVSLQAAFLSTTIAGDSAVAGFADGSGAAAHFDYPQGIAFDSADNNLYVTDTTNNCAVRQVSSGGAVVTIAGVAGACGLADGSGTGAHFDYPRGIAYDTATHDLYVTDTDDCAIRAVTTSGAATTVAGAAGSCGFADGTGSAANLNYPAGIAYDSGNGDLYVTDTGNCVIRQVTTAGALTTIAGTAGTCGFADGTGASAQFNKPSGIAYDSSNGDLYVTDTYNCAIRQITAAGAVTTVAGAAGVCAFADGTGANASFNYPSGIAYDPASGNLYVTDTSNCVIREMTTAGAVSTIAGTAGTCGFADGPGTNSQFNYPSGIAYDSADGIFYVTDQFNNTIRQVQL